MQGVILAGEFASIFYYGGARDLYISTGLDVAQPNCHDYKPYCHTLRDHKGWRKVR